MLAPSGDLHRTLTAPEYASLTREWVARIAAAAGVSPPVVVETEGGPPRVRDGGRRVEVPAGQPVPWVWFVGAMAKSLLDSHPPGTAAVSDDMRPDRLAAHFVLQDHGFIGEGDQRRLTARLRGGMAFGRENEAAVEASDNHPGQKTVFARTRLLTVESGGLQPTTIEIVRTPARVLPAERGWPDRRLLRLAEQDAMWRLAGVQVPTAASVVYPAGAGYRVTPELAGHLIQPLMPNMAWVSQTTVAPTLSQITSAMRRIVAATPLWADVVRASALGAADFGDNLAAELAPGASYLDRTALSSVLATVYGHVIALATSVVTERLPPKRFLPFLSRVWMSGLRRALPDHLASLLTDNHAYISQRVNAYFAEQRPYGVVPESDVLTWRMTNGHPIQVFLDNLLLPNPAVVITQEIFGAHTQMPDVDRHDGLIPEGVAPIEVRAPMPDMPQWPDTRAAQLIGITRELYLETGQPLDDGARIRVEPPWGGDLAPGAVIAEVTLPARIVNVDPALTWILASDTAAVLVDPQNGLLRVVSLPLPAGSSQEQVRERLAAATTLVNVIQAALLAGGPVAAFAGLPLGTVVNPLATPGWQVVPTRTAYEQTVEATVNVAADGVLPTLLLLQQTLDRSKPWYEPASIAGTHLDAAINWGQQQAQAIGGSAAAAGYLALLYLEHAGLVHVLHDALPETYAAVTSRPGLPALLATLPSADQQTILGNSAYLINSFEAVFASANPELIADLEAEAVALGHPVNTFDRPLWPSAESVRSSLIRALSMAAAGAGSVLLDLRYFQRQVDHIISLLLNQASPA